jgi:hypothetical protein
VLLTQGGAVQFDPNGNAPVRVFSALPASASVPVIATVGCASPYVGVTLARSTVLELIEPSVAPVTASVSLTSPQSVYSVFVIDASLTPYAIRDR